MNALRTVAVIAALALLAGFLWDVLVWRLGFPYLPFHWLVGLLHADGESAYAAMMCEMQVFFFVVFSFAWFLWRCVRQS